MNRLSPRRLLTLGIAAGLALASAFAAGQSVLEGRTAQERRFVTGGIGLDESEHLKAVSRDFSLSVLVATKSGAYLADTHITVTDAQGQTVLDAQSAGPYLLVDLARGVYKVEATYLGEKRQQRVSIGTNTHTNVAFAFNVPD